MQLSDNEILNYLYKNGIVDANTIQTQMEMEQNKKYLDMHKFKKWKGSDGNWHTYIPDSAKGRVPKKRKTEEELDRIIIDYWKGQVDNPTIKEVFTEWNDRRLALGKISNSTNCRNRQCFERHYKEFGKRKIKTISAEEIADFLEEQIPKYNLTAKAFSNLKGITKGFLKRAKKQRLISFNVEELMNELDVSDTEFKKTIKEDYEEVFDDEEMDKIVNCLINNLDTKNVGILLMFVAGIRVGELVALKHEVFDGNTFKIKRMETRYENADKTSKQKYVYEVKEFAKTDAGIRTVVIPNDYQWLCKKITTLNPFGEYIFVDKNGKRMTTNCFRRRLERLCRQLDIHPKSPHKIRKTYGSILLDNNVDKNLVIQQMGHTDIAVTENHYHRNRKSIEKKVEILSAIPEFSMLNVKI